MHLPYTTQLNFDAKASVQSILYLSCHSFPFLTLSTHSLPVLPLFLLTLLLPVSNHPVSIFRSVCQSKVVGLTLEATSVSVSRAMNTPLRTPLPTSMDSLWRLNTSTSYATKRQGDDGLCLSNLVYTVLYLLDIHFT